MAADFDENATKQMMVDIHHDPLDWIKKENIIPEEPVVSETLNIVIKKEFIAEGEVFSKNSLNHIFVGF